jgi:hypothetical protein
LDANTMTDPTPATLFPIPEAGPEAAVPDVPATSMAAPRLRKPERGQVTMHCESLDERLPPDHLARDIWNFVQGLDMTPLLEEVKPSRAGSAAMPPTHAFS